MAEDPLIAQIKKGKFVSQIGSLEYVALPFILYLFGTPYGVSDWMIFLACILNVFPMMWIYNKFEKISPDHLRPGERFVLQSSADDFFENKSGGYDWVLTSQRLVLYRGSDFFVIELSDIAGVRMSIPDEANYKLKIGSSKNRSELLDEFFEAYAVLKLKGSGLSVFPPDSADKTPERVSDERALRFNVEGARKLVGLLNRALSYR